MTAARKTRPRVGDHVVLQGTNDLRRRVGQALVLLERSLLFWSDKGLSFFDTVRLWSIGAAGAFGSTAAALQGASKPARDRRLRRFTAEALEQLAAHLERGEAHRLAFVRWLVPRFAALTRMIREEPVDSRVLDFEMARDLSRALSLAAGSGPSAMAGRLRALAGDLVRPAEPS